MAGELKESIEALNRACSEGKTPAHSLNEKIAPFCQKKYLFDLVSACLSVESRTIKQLAELFPKAEGKWGWVFLCALRPPREEPMEWDPSQFDYHYFGIMLQFLERLRLPSDEFQVLAEYPLRISVLNLLLSEALADCRGEVLEEWDSEEFYERLLLRKWDFVLGRRYRTEKLAKDFISSVAQLFERYGLERPSFGLNAVMSYAGDEKVMGAMRSLFEWLVSNESHPVLFDFVLGEYLVPHNGLLLPNERVINEDLRESETELWGLLGSIDLRKPLLGLKRFLKKRACSGDKEGKMFISAYVLWHKSQGLFEELLTYLTKRWGARPSSI